MNIDKPESVYFAMLPLEWKGSLHASFTVSMGFDLLNGAILPADKAYAAAMKSLPKAACLDMGVPKSCAEWLLCGNAYAPADVPVKGMGCDIHVGGSRRRFLLESEEPFASMPLDWHNTWRADDENPEGLQPKNIRRAPLSDADAVFGKPACPGPRGAWPCRMRHMGTYNEDWLMSRWPGTPDDFDPSYYNLAQPAQFLPQGIPFGEKVEMTNLHPKYPRISATLTDFRPRLYFERKGETFEGMLRADTLWLFPNQLTGLLLWHFVTPCANETAADISLVRIEAMEPEAEVKPVQAAAPVSEKADSSKAAPKLSGMTVGMPSAAAAGGVDSAASSASTSETDAPSTETSQQDSPHDAPTMDELTAKFDESLDEINAGLAEAGLPPMTPAQIEETKQRMAKFVDFAKDVENPQVAEPSMEDVLRMNNVPESQILSVNRALELERPDPADYTDALSWSQACEAYIADYSREIHPSQNVTDLMRTAMKAQGPGGEEYLQSLAGPVPSETDILVQAGMKPDAVSRMLTMLDGDIPDDMAGRKAFADSLEKASGFEPGSIRGHIEKVEAMMKKCGIPVSAQKPVSDAQLAAEALKAAPIKGDSDVIKTASAMESAAANETDALAGTAAAVTADKAAWDDIALALLDRASLAAYLSAGKKTEGISFDGCDLSGMNLSGRSFRGASFKGAKLKGSDFSHCNLSGTDFSDADLSQCSFGNADLSGAKLRRANAADADFVKSRLDEADMTAITAPEADFSKATLLGTVMVEAAMHKARFDNSTADGINAEKADMTGSRFYMTTMKNSSFRGANLTQCDIHACDLDKSSFTEAILKKTVFCYETHAENSDFTGADISDGIWTDASACGSFFTGVRAAGAMFTDCRLASTQWKLADIKNGDFSRSIIRGADMTGANLFRASLRECRAEGCNFESANLYGADLYRFARDANTNLRKSDCTSTVLAARREV